MRRPLTQSIRLLWIRVAGTMRNWIYHRPAAIRRTVRRLQRQLSLYDADVSLYVACHLWQDRRDVAAPSVLPRRDRRMMEAAMVTQIMDLWRTCDDDEQHKLLIAMAIDAMLRQGDHDHMVLAVADADDAGRPDPGRVLSSFVAARGDAADDLLDAAREMGFAVPGGGA